jgi:hypothetical protein
MATLVIPPPPRLSGLSQPEQISQIANYNQQIYAALLKIADAVSDIGALGELDLDITNPPTQAEVETVRDRLNSVIIQAGQIVL